MRWLWVPKHAEGSVNGGTDPGPPCALGLAGSLL